MPSHHQNQSQRQATDMEGGAMVEAGAMFAALLAALRVIEKLVDKKMNNGGPRPVQIDLNQGELNSNMGQMVECMASTTQTLERINDRLDEVHEKSTKIEMIVIDVDRVSKETGSNVFAIRTELENKARDRAAEERGAARERAKIGE